MFWLCGICIWEPSERMLWRAPAASLQRLLLCARECWLPVAARPLEVSLIQGLSKPSWPCQQLLGPGTLLQPGAELLQHRGHPRRQKAPSFWRWVCQSQTREFSLQWRLALISCIWLCFLRNYTFQFAVFSLLQARAGNSVGRGGVGGALRVWVAFNQPFVL